MDKSLLVGMRDQSLAARIIDMKSLFDISGKTAIVTGGSSGIGAMIAQGFVENPQRRLFQHGFGRAFLWRLTQQDRIDLMGCANGVGDIAMLRPVAGDDDQSHIPLPRQLVFEAAQKRLVNHMRFQLAWGLIMQAAAIPDIF